jgi:hypothetical protein
MGRINELGTCEVSVEGAAETARSYSEHVHREVKRAFATRSHPVRSVMRAAFHESARCFKLTFDGVQLGWEGLPHYRRRMPLISLLTSRSAPLVCPTLVYMVPTVGACRSKCRNLASSFRIFTAQPSAWLPQRETR